MLCWTRNKVKMKSFPLSNKYCMHQALLEPLALWGCMEVTALHNTHRYSAAPVASGREARYDSPPLFLYLVILVPPFLKPTDRVFGFFFFFETTEQAVIFKGSLFLQCFEQTKPCVILRPEWEFWLGLQVRPGRPCGFYKRRRWLLSFPGPLQCITSDLVIGDQWH